MSRTSIPAELSERCRAALEAAWPGVRVLQLRVQVIAGEPWQDAADVSISVRITLSGAEQQLVQLGLLSEQEAASIPPCGVCQRGGVKISRGRTRTRLVIGNAADLTAPIVVSALAWSPPQAA